MKIRTSLAIGLGAGLLCVAMTPIALAAPQQYAEAAAMTEPEEGPPSDQPVSDTWITTKVKTDLLATSDVPGSAISVETVNGVVKLSGMVDSKAHVDRAIEVTRSIKGVKSVDASGLKVGKAKSGY